MLEALVRKTETIREQLGSAGQVIEERIAKRLAEGGIDARPGRGARAGDRGRERRRAARPRPRRDGRRGARPLRAAPEGAGRSAARRWRTRASASASIPTTQARGRRGACSARAVARRRSRPRRVGDGRDLPLRSRRSRLRARSRAGQDAFDDLRARPRKRGERLSEWRKRAPVRAIAFEPPRLPDGRDAASVVQVHLEHRLVRRLLSRFLSQGFQADLSRVCVIDGPGAQPRVVLIGRLALYGAGRRAAARGDHPGHRDLDRGRARPQAAAAARRERRGDDARTSSRRRCATPRQAPAMAVAARAGRGRAGHRRPRCRRWSGIAAERLADGQGASSRKRGEEEARSLAELLEQQRERIAKARAEFDPNQLAASGPRASEERREREADRRHWQARLARSRRELREEPARVRASYEVRAASAGAGRPRLSLAGDGMSAMATEIKRDPDLEWLDHVQPVGLVVAPSAAQGAGPGAGAADARRTRRGRRALVGRRSSSPRCPIPGRSSSGPRLGGAPRRRRAGRAGAAGRAAGAPAGARHHAAPTWAVRELGEGGRRGSSSCASRRRRRSGRARRARRLGGDAAPALRAAAARDRRLPAADPSDRMTADRYCRSCGSSTRRAARPPAHLPSRCARSRPSPAGRCSAG